MRAAFAVALLVVVTWALCARAVDLSAVDDPEARSYYHRLMDTMETMDAIEMNQQQGSDLELQASTPYTYTSKGALALNTMTSYNNLASRAIEYYTVTIPQSFTSGYTFELTLFASEESGTEIGVVFGSSFKTSSTSSPSGNYYSWTTSFSNETIQIPSCFVATKVPASTMFVFVASDSFSSTAAASGYFMITAVPDPCVIHAFNEAVNVVTDKWYFWTYSWSLTRGAMLTFDSTGSGSLRVSGSVPDDKASTSTYYASTPTGSVIIGLKTGFSSTGATVSLTNTAPVSCTTVRTVTCTGVTYPTPNTTSLPFALLFDALFSFAGPSAFPASNCGTNLYKSILCMTLFPQCDDNAFLLPVCYDWCTQASGCTVTGSDGRSQTLSLATCGATVGNASFDTGTLRIGAPGLTPGTQCYFMTPLSASSSIQPLTSLVALLVLLALAWLL